MAEGVPLTIRLKVLDTGNGSQPLEGAAVYVWHCDREGRYSMYTEGITGENYLRGVQATAGDGTLTFTSIYDGYSLQLAKVTGSVADGLTATLNVPV